VGVRLASKKKVGFWETIGVFAALAAWRATAADLPTDGLIIPPDDTKPKFYAFPLPGGGQGYTTKPPPGAEGGPPPCSALSQPAYSQPLGKWLCVPKGLLDEYT